MRRLPGVQKTFNEPPLLGQGIPIVGEVTRTFSPRGFGQRRIKGWTWEALPNWWLIHLKAGYGRFSKFSRVTLLFQILGQTDLHYICMHKYIYIVLSIDYKSSNAYLDVPKCMSINLRK